MNPDSYTITFEVLKNKEITQDTHIYKLIVDNLGVPPKYILDECEESKGEVLEEF